MAGRRFLLVLALLGSVISTGCRSWCERWYPSAPPGACYAPQPCCCTPCVPAAGYQTPAAGWNQPQPCPPGCIAH